MNAKNRIMNKTALLMPIFELNIIFILTKIEVVSPIKSGINIPSSINEDELKYTFKVFKIFELFLVEK